jgi:iron complex transport system substrate-binding protein
MQPVTPPFKRIVSLAPAITEIVFALGMADRLVGVTDSCDYPHGACQIPNISCWFEPDMEKLAALEPDLVLGLETAHRQLHPELAEKGIHLVLVNPTRVDAALDVMLELGELLEASAAGATCVRNLRARLAVLDQKVAKIPGDQRITVCRVLDTAQNRLIVAGPLSFQFDIISRAGGLNVTGRCRTAYPKATWRQLERWDPDMIFFCGHDRRFIPNLKADPKWRALKAGRSGRLYQFDCALTCRIGPRIVDMAELLYNTLYENQ